MLTWVCRPWVMYHGDTLTTLPNDFRPSHKPTRLAAQRPEAQNRHVLHAGRSFFFSPASPREAHFFSFFCTPTCMVKWHGFLPHAKAWTSPSCSNFLLHAHGCPHAPRPAPATSRASTPSLSSLLPCKPQPHFLLPHAYCQLLQLLGRSCKQAKAPAKACFSNSLPSQLFTNSAP